MDPGDAAAPALIVGVLGDEPVMELSDRVGVGEEVVIRIESYGLSGCWRKGETRVTVDGLRATVRPFDTEPSGEQACTAHIPVFTHEATLRFHESGTARVTVEGRRLEGREPVSFTREVAVGAEPSTGG